jgi:Carboxypeptidase regulatory-like domain
VRLLVLLMTCLISTVACHPGPIIGAKSVSAGGTIAGIVSTTDSAVAVPGRTVTAINVRTGSRHTATTAGNGGYTIKVPEGTYRLEIELRSGEKLTKKPDDTSVTNGDLDPGRDFTISAGSLAPRTRT